MFSFINKKKSPEQVLKETPLQEVFSNMSPTNEDYRQAEEQMSSFTNDSKKELEINALELDKYMVSISGGAIGLLLAFLTFVQINNFGLLALRNFGFAAIVLLTLCILCIVLSYMFAVARARTSLEISHANDDLKKFIHNRPQDDQYWKEANGKKNKYCDLVSKGRNYNWMVHYSNKGAPIFFMLGIISLAVFLIINLAKLSHMGDENDNQPISGQQSQQSPRRVEKAADLPDTTYDQMVANAIQALKQQNSEGVKSNGK